MSKPRCLGAMMKRLPECVVLWVGGSALVWVLVGMFKGYLQGTVSDLVVTGLSWVMSLLAVGYAVFFRRGKQL